MAGRPISVVPTNNQQSNCRTLAHTLANQEQVQVSIISTLESNSQCSGQEIAGRNLVGSDERAQQKKKTSENSHENFPSCFMENVESSGKEEAPLNNSDKDRVLSVTDGKSLDQSQPITSGTQRLEVAIILEGDHEMKTAHGKVKYCSVTELQTNCEDLKEEQKCCSKDIPTSLMNRPMISCDNDANKEIKCPPEISPNDHSNIAAVLGPSLLKEAISSVRCPPLMFGVSAAERIFASLKVCLLQCSGNILLCGREHMTHWRCHVIMSKAEGLLGLNDFLLGEFMGCQLNIQWTSSCITMQHEFQLSAITFSKCCVPENGWEHLSYLRNNPTTSGKYCTYFEVKRVLSQSTQGIAKTSLHEILESPSKHIWYRKWQIINYTGKQRLSLYEIRIFHNSLYQLLLHLQQEVCAVKGQHLIEVLPKPSELSLHSLHHKIKFDSNIWLDDTDITVADQTESDSDNETDSNNENQHEDDTNSANDHSTDGSENHNRNGGNNINNSEEEENNVIDGGLQYPKQVESDFDEDDSESTLSTNATDCAYETYHLPVLSNVSINSSSQTEPIEIDFHTIPKEQDEIHGFQQQDYSPPTLEAQQESCEHSSMKNLFVMGQMKREL